MDEREVNCDVCGGNDFYKEAGYYYCNECQTQSQHVREQVLDIEFNENINLLTQTSKRKIKKTKVLLGDNVNKITSWETFNCVMVGLTNELISLGATHNFKDITYNLWICYLNKLQLISNNSSVPPKLGPLYRKKDAEIIYNKKIKRKRKKKSVSSTDMSDLSKKQIGRFVGTKKRALIKRDYTAITSSQASEPSLQNQTLSNLASDSDSSIGSGTINYNKYARKELLKHMSRKHIEAHEDDAEGKLKCHKMVYRNLSNEFKSGPYMLTKNKLYCVLYLSLLLTSNKIQLADILRYCREGRLSFMEYRQFLPDDFTDKDIEPSLFLDAHKTLVTSEFIRKNTYSIYKFLDLKPCNFSPNLLNLCRRYCTELNLPDEIYNIVGTLIVQTKPEMDLKNMKCLPNYEGRVMAFILYILKVLFGLDSATENKFTKFARQLNEHRNESKVNKLLKKKMFVWADWVNYIEYRKIVLKRVHFPTKYVLEPNGIAKPDLFLNFFMQKKAEYVREPQTLSTKIARKFLEDLLERQDSENENAVIDFEHSFTPFRSYMQTLQEKPDFEIEGNALRADILQDFSDHSVEYLIHSKPYLLIISPDKEIVTKAGGANTDYKYMKINKSNNVQIENEEWLKLFEKHKEEAVSLELLAYKLLNKRLENVSQGLKFAPKKQEQNINELYRDERVAKIKDKVARAKSGRFCKLNSSDKKTDTNYKRCRSRGEWFLSSWSENPLVKTHKYNPSLLQQVSAEENLENPLEQNLLSKRSRCDSTNSEEHSIKKHCSNTKYNTHYVPRLDYWINVCNLSNLTLNGFEDMETTFPISFKWLLKECARTIEQTPKELFMEFVTVELYISYFHLDNAPILNDVNHKMLKKLIKKAQDQW